MSPLSTFLKLSVTLLAATRVLGSPARDEETDTSNKESTSTTAGTDDIQTLPHDQVVSIPQLTPSNEDEEVYLAYKPLVRVLHGCHPFPAVDAQGRIGRGLKPSGPSDGECAHSVGQVYVRSAPLKEWFALLYIWYHPKNSFDQSFTGTRHSWDGVAVILKSRNATDRENIYAVCPSVSGKWRCASQFLVRGTSPLVDYDGSDYFTFYLTSSRNRYTVLEEQPLLAWESMPKAAKEALSQYNYGKVQVPFIDAHFNETLAGINPSELGIVSLPHDSIASMIQMTPEGPTGTLYLTYQPRLKVRHGCVPFPAVDFEGRMSEGLAPTGPSGGHGSLCGGNIGQVYVRSARVGKLFALLYTWFQPKDHRGARGNRYDWEGTVVYVKNRNESDASNIVAVCPSAGGKWTCSTKFSLDGTFPLIEYNVAHKSSDNTCFLSDQKGEHHPLVAWESMPPAAVVSLSLWDFLPSKVPFIDASFNATLALAAPPV